MPGTEIGEPTPTQICELLIDVAMQSLFGKMQEIHAQQVESMQRIEHLAQEIEQILIHRAVIVTFASTEVSTFP